jgi:type II secretory pathway pseudopilin PulG
MSPRVIIARLRVASTRDDAGITLVELIVGMALTLIVGAMTLALFLQINTSTDSTVDRTVNTASARNAIQAWTAYLRVADSTTPAAGTNRLEWLTPNDMLFYADLFNRSFDSVDTISGPTMIWLRLDAAGSLVEEQFAASATAGTVPKTCRTLVTGVSTPPALFTAYDANQDLMATDHGQLGSAPAAAAGCRPLPVTVPSQLTHPSAAQAAVQNSLQSVSSVVIDFVVRDQQNKHPLEFDSQAILPAVYAGGA